MRLRIYPGSIPESRKFILRLAGIQRVLLPFWLLLIGAGFWLLLKYEKTPGQAAAADVDWPSNAAMVIPVGSGPVLIMAVHPECPCSRTSMGELAELLARFPNKLTCYVLFVRTGAISVDDCRKSVLWKTVTAIRGATPVVDDGKLAVTRFHARTSGQVLLYDTFGKLQFSGGITAARDHAGRNDGSEAIASFLTTGQASPSHTPVFGCSLQ